MKTFKQFNEEAQYHLHEIDRLGFGIPGSGLLMKGLGYLNRATNPLYKGYGAYKTTKDVYKSIKDKKGPAHTALSALSGLQYAAPLNRGKNFASQIGNFLKSKRLYAGLGAEATKELIDDGEFENKKTSNKTNNKVGGAAGKAAKVVSNSKPKKYLTDLDLYKK
tara:strand:+ start:610 stop:1101 length:492 start_codon:yes stop_codon:yes gene_type:complete